MALVYHAGQIEVQEEANTRPAAENLADWVGPVGQFASVADMFLLASADEAGDLRFAAAVSSLGARNGRTAKRSKARNPRNAAPPATAGKTHEAPGKAPAGPCRHVR